MQKSTLTPVEVLTPIWERVLQRPTITAEDNFFDLGGDSLLAVQLFSEIARVCGRELAPVTIYCAPTISALAEILEEPTAPILANWENILRPGLSPEEQLQDYFALCLACHHATVATFVPTDVDTKIRGIVWRESRDPDVSAAHAAPGPGLARLDRRRHLDPRRPRRQRPQRRTVERHRGRPGPPARTRRYRFRRRSAGRHRSRDRSRAGGLRRGRRRARRRTRPVAPLDDPGAQPRRSDAGHGFLEAHRRSPRR